MLSELQQSKLMLWTTLYCKQAAASTLHGPPPSAGNCSLPLYGQVDPPAGCQAVIAAQQHASLIVLRSPREAG